MTDPRPAALVFCERVDNQNVCESVLRELSAHVDVRPFGPGWPIEHLDDVDLTGAAFYLELDAVTGCFVRPGGLGRLDLPKFAWLIDTHKKPDFHRQISRDVDLTFFAMKTWGHVFDRPAAWLPLHADAAHFQPVEAERRWDLVFVGSQTWRAEPIERIARKHHLSVHVATTTGPREKTDTAALYAQARLVFNRHVTNDLNFRLFEAPACGRVLLTDAQHNGQYELFEDDRHLVLYKDDRDLEHQVLRLLADPDLRARIEREAALHAQAHTTRARVAELVRQIVATLSGVSSPSPRGRALARSLACDELGARDLSDQGCAHPAPHSTTPATVRAASSPSSTPATTERPRRWLVLATAGESPTVDLLGYSDRLARDLARRGHEVVVALPRRARLTPRNTAATDRLSFVYLDAGPLPTPPTDENAMLAAAGPAQRQLDLVAREHGPFDAILAEGPIGQLVSVPLADRLGVPLLLALPTCEVLRRENRLARPQLYTAELEHWAADRAHRVLTPWTEAGAALRQHYQLPGIDLVPFPPSDREPPSPPDLQRLRARVGLQDPFVLVLAGRDPDRPRVPSVVWSSDRATYLPLGMRTSRPLRGPALAALLSAADAVVLDACDPRRADAASFARRVAMTDALRSPDQALALVARAHSPAAKSPVSTCDLERLLDAPRRREVPLVLR